MKKSSKLNYSNLSSMGSRYQTGGTMWGLLFNCGILLFAAYIGMKLVPVYSNKSAIQGALESVVAEFPLSSKVSKKAIIKGMEKRLYIDGINTSGLYDNLVVSKNDNEAEVAMPYQKVIPLFAEISLLLDFEATAKK